MKDSITIVKYGVVYFRFSSIKIMIYGNCSKNTQELSKHFESGSLIKVGRVQYIDYKALLVLNGMHENKEINDLIEHCNQLYKVCQDCKQLKEKSEFHKDSSQKSGLHSYCKSCKNSKNKSIMSNRNTLLNIRKESELFYGKMEELFNELVMENRMLRQENEELKSKIEVNK